MHITLFITGMTTLPAPCTRRHTGASPEQRAGKNLTLATGYSGDDRSAAQQRAFESVEYKPQALKWIFSIACHWRFRVSLDNLTLSRQGLLDSGEFEAAIVEQARAWRDGGLPERADRFYTALCAEFDNCLPLHKLQLDLSDFDYATNEVM